MSNDVEASQFDIGTTSIRLLRAGNVAQILFSSAFEARYLYEELAERDKRAQDKLGCLIMEKLSKAKRAELRLIAELTLDATLAAEEKISRIAEKGKAPTTSR